MATNNSILTVGSMAFDTITTPAGRAEKCLGGSVNYFSVASSLFSPVRILGVVGNDFPKDHIDWLSKRGIDTSGVEVMDGETFHWEGDYRENLNEAKTISTCLNVFETFKPTLSDLHKSTPYVFLANIDPDLQLSVLDQMKDYQLVACDSMNFWITGKPDRLKETLKRIDILTINEAEAQMLSGETNLIKAAKKVRELGPSVVIVKRGEYGATLFTERDVFMAPAFPVEDVIDPTGAGDSFAGGFMGYLAQQGPAKSMAKEDPDGWKKLLRRSVVNGCVMASFTVQDFSLKRIMRLTKKEFQARFDAYVDMMRI